MFSAQLMQQIINYLVTKPWGEVNGLLAAIDTEAKASQPASKPEAMPAEEE